MAPLHTTDYAEAMHRLTKLQADHFKVAQMNVVIMHNWQTDKDEPYCVYWLERPMMALVANPPTSPA